MKVDQNRKRLQSKVSRHCPLPPVIPWREPPTSSPRAAEACPAADGGSLIQLTRGSQQAKVLTSRAKPKHSRRHSGTRLGMPARCASCPKLGEATKLSGWPHPPHSDEPLAAGKARIRSSQAKRR